MDWGLAEAGGRYLLTARIDKIISDEGNFRTIVLFWQGLRRQWKSRADAVLSHYQSGEGVSVRCDIDRWAAGQRRDSGRPSQESGLAGKTDKENWCFAAQKNARTPAKNRGADFMNSKLLRIQFWLSMILREKPISFEESIDYGNNVLQKIEHFLSMEISIITWMGTSIPKSSHFLQATFLPIGNYALAFMPF